MTKIRTAILGLACLTSSGTSFAADAAAKPRDLTSRAPRYTFANELSAQEAQLKDNLAAASWRLTAEEMLALDEVSALPEPYPMWHQHKFGIERNPRLPARRS